jgi:hypothetical protein
MMQMRIRERKDGAIFYAIGNGSRIVYGLFCLLIGLGFVTVIMEGGFSGAAIIPLLLFLISFIGLGYRESWEFNPQSQTIVYRVGFLLWIKQSQFSVADVNFLEISHFVRGRSPLDIHAKPKGRNKAMVVFSLHLHDDSVKDIEIAVERTSAGRVEATALRIATAMGLGYYADREYDSTQTVSMHDI